MSTSRSSRTAKSGEPGDDLISGLVTDYVATGQLSRETKAMTAVITMQDGHETSANMIALGTVALLQHRDVFERLGQTDDHAVIANTVEQLMPYLTTVHRQRPKYPRTLGFRVRAPVYRAKPCPRQNASRVRNVGAAPTRIETGSTR